MAKKRIKQTSDSIQTTPELLLSDPTSFLYQPHDKYLKVVFSIKLVAEQFIRYCLPPQKLAELKLDTLQIENNSFIDQKLKNRFADTVYSLQSKNNEDFRLSTILEFKSDKDGSSLPLQILRYCLSAMEYDLRQKRPIRPTYYT